jgi:hypothetical protein
MVLRSRETLAVPTGGCGDGRTFQRDTILLTLKMEGGNPSQECGWPVRNWKRQGNQFPTRALRKEYSPVDTLIPARKTYVGFYPKMVR